MAQQGSVTISQADDGGEIEVVNGLVTMGSGLGPVVYLSLFGGNTDDPGEDDTTYTWWGNLMETETANTYRSETQYLLRRGLPLTTAKLLRAEQAATRDLEWMTSEGVASSIDVTLELESPQRIAFTVDIDGDESLTFYANWSDV